MTVQEMIRSASIEIAAGPTEVYETVRQLERMGEWSPENTGGSWIQGDGTAVGDRFEGHNERGDMQWSQTVTVNQAVAGSVFAFHTGPPGEPSVQWTYEMTPTANGTRLTETWDVVALPPELAAWPDYPEWRKPLIEDALASTLAALKATIEG